MAYPMTYRRVVQRNDLGGDYGHGDAPGDWRTNPEVRARMQRNLIAGDLRRLERDQRDAVHLVAYARRAGVTVEQARAVLDAFFDEEFVTRDIPPDEYEALRAAGRDGGAPEGG